MAFFAANGVLLIHVQLCAYQDSRSFSANLLSVNPELVTVISHQEQDLAFHIVQCNEIPIGPFLLPFKVPLNSSTTIWWVNHCSPFHRVCELAEASLGPITLVINAKQYWIAVLITPLVTGLQLDFIPLMTTP